MPVSPETIQFLRCPDTGEVLVELSPSDIELLNRAIDQKKLTNRIGKTVGEKFETALINESRTWIYSVRSSIVCLIQDEAVSAKSIEAQGD